MWNTTGRPDSLTTPPVSNATDHYNNNPYSRNSFGGHHHSTVPQQKNDPWSWGLDDEGSSNGQGSGKDENELWGAQTTSLHQPQQHKFNTITPISSNSSDFFESIDLKSSATTNNLFNQPSHQSQYHPHYSHLPQQQQQQNFLQQAPTQPQISTDSSYSYFQFAAQQGHSVNTTSLVNQYSGPASQPQPPYNNHAIPHFQPQQSQPQFMQTNNYNQFSSPTPFSQHHTAYNNNSDINSSSIVNNNISAEVENREIAPPEKLEKNLNVVQPSTSSPSLPPSTPALTTSVVCGSKSNSSIVPENQETVPENEERPPDPDMISTSMSNLNLSSPPVSESTGITSATNDLQQWNSVPGWENQEVAPRFTVDRNQYLETGHLHPPSSGHSQSQLPSAADKDNDDEVDVDTNDEGEAVPPPGLHRLVTGQGQTGDQERLVLGSPPPMSLSSGPTSLSQRPQVPGHSMQQTSDLSAHPPLGQRMIPGQLRDNELERMVLGSSGNSNNDNLSNMQQPREQLQSNPVSQRTVPGGRSNDVQQPRDRDQASGDHVSQRTVPGGSSTSSSSGGSNSSYTQHQDLPSEERLVLGRPNVDHGDDRLQPQHSSTGVVHNVSSSSNSFWTSGSVIAGHQDTIASHQTLYTGDSELASQQPARPPSVSNNIVGAEQSRSNSLASDPPIGLHRMVVGHPDNHSRGGSASGDEMSQSGVPPPGLHRMVLGEQQEQKQQTDQQQPSSSQQGQSVSQGSTADNEDCDKDREIHSDSDYRINKRKQHHRRDSIEDDNYPSDREREQDRRHPGPDYWDRRYDERSRRHYKDRSHHPSYDHSPEFRSEEELDRERNDFRDLRDYRPIRHRDRDRDRDRERDRGDRRRQSPDYFYRDDEFRDDPRRPGRSGRYYDPHHYRNRGDMYEDDYYYQRENRSSRPSSRSGMEYTRRPGGPGGGRDFVPPRSVHQYYPDQAYQMHYYQMQQQLYEMRRNDPQAYAAWYEQYMASKYGQSIHHPDDGRISGPSGRSSANQQRSSNEKVRMDETSMSGVSSKGTLNASGVPSGVQSGVSIDSQMNNEEASEIGNVSQRYTPQLYPGGAHIKGKWSKQGQLVLVSPNYPREGQPPIVEIAQLSYSTIQNDPDILEFLEFPGPFVVGSTHKNTVLQYLKKRGDQASHNAERLLYELMQLVIRLNGVVDMTDVADLLMNNYNDDPGAEHDQNYQQQQQQQQYADAFGQFDDNRVNPETSAQQVTDRFRDLLLQGNKQDALEWAMLNKNWGHAFFLASKMDTRSYNNVMLRFANGLPINDPLQTLYQMMSGREPQAATCCADQKWGDWRPHLAMMLSNPSGNPDLDRKSIITLGDSLASRGRLFASHFCYVTAQVDFAAYTDRNAKLVLLGTSHLQPFAQFATCRSIMLTLCYEYAKRLNKKNLTIPALQVYKYVLATRLIENGKLPIASQYLEAIALDMIHRPSRQNRSLALLVAELADQIKMSDPALAMINDPNDDPDWLNTLKQILDETNETNLLTSSMSHGISTSTVSTSAADPPPMTNQVVGGYAQDPLYYDNNAWNQTENQNLDSLQYSGYPTAQNIEVVEDQYNQHQYTQQQSLHQHQQTQIQQQMPITDVGVSLNTDYMSNLLQQQPQQNPNTVPWDPMNNMYTNNWQDQSQAQQQQHMMPPTMPPVPANSLSTATRSQEQLKTTIEKKTNKDESSARRSGKKSKEQSSGWFGGIWDKFSFKPKNEMKLPDDKDPSIVWDEKKGRWVNKDADEEDEALNLKPPPKASELPGFSNPSIPAPSIAPPAPVPITTPMVENNTIHTNAPVAASTPNANSSNETAPSSTSTTVNKFKLGQRGRNMKANYIDVLNMNSNKPTHSLATVPPPMLDPVPTAAAPVNNFFIPAPVEGNENAPIDFVSPSGPVSYEASHKSLDQNTEMNYSSQEVPAFYNPNSFTVT